MVGEIETKANSAEQSRAGAELGNIQLVIGYIFLYILPFHWSWDKRKMNMYPGKLQINVSKHTAIWCQRRPIWVFFFETALKKNSAGTDEGPCSQVWPYTQALIDTSGIFWHMCNIFVSGDSNLLFVLPGKQKSPPPQILFFTWNPVQNFITLGQPLALLGEKYVTRKETKNNLKNSGHFAQTKLFFGGSWGI